jgi:hypothetical protein
MQLNLGEVVFRIWVCCTRVISRRAFVAKFIVIEYADPTDIDKSGGEKQTGFKKFLASGKYPLEQRIEDKKRGIGRQRYPFVSEF